MFVRFCCLVLAAAVLGVSHAWACNSGTVRDAAFLGRRDQHRLCLIAAKDDPAAEEHFQRMTDWFDAQGERLNVVLERVDPNDPELRWADYGMPSAPPSLPVTVLVGSAVLFRRPFMIDHWKPAPSDEELGRLLTSPALEAAKKPLVDVWAVLVYTKGGDGFADPTPVLEDFAKRWGEERPPGIALVEMDRKDPAEWLLTTLGELEPDGPPWAGVMFGRGKMMPPFLKGDDLTAAHLEELLAQLIVPCTCLQESLALGLDLPMRWEESLDERFAELEAVAQNAFGGYTEVTLDAQLDEQVDQMIGDTAEAPKQLFVMALLPLGVGAAVVAVAIALMVWHAARRNRPPENDS